MFPVDLVVVSRLIQQERLLDAERNRGLRQLSRKHSAWGLRLWIGEHLVRWGNRLMAHYPTTAFQNDVNHTARMA